LELSQPTAFGIKSQPTTFGSQPTCNPVIIFLEEKEGLGRTENNWFFLCLFFTHISKIT
jgi:hypothetical protein